MLTCGSCILYYIKLHFPGNPSWIPQSWQFAITNNFMAVFTELITAFAVMIPLLAEPALAGSIADIEHVILFMQGTRLFAN